MRRPSVWATHSLSLSLLLGDQQASLLFPSHRVSANICTLITTVHASITPFVRDPFNDMYSPIQHVMPTTCNNSISGKLCYSRGRTTSSL